MRFKLSYLVVTGLALGSASAASCGLISKDILSTSFSLPPKSYAFDTAVWHLPSGSFPAVPCGAGQLVEDCCNPPDGLPKPDCSVNMLSCDDAVCTLHVPISVSQTMDLKKEVPALSGFSNQSLINVSITRITYSFASTMNIDLPPVELFIAPDGVTSADDPAAEKFGTTHVIPAGATGDDTVDLAPNAGAAFAARAHHFGTPFNFIARTSVVIPSGSPIPSGGVNLTVQGTAKASL
jgi:hypothetical protein